MKDSTLLLLGIVAVAAYYAYTKTVQAATAAAQATSDVANAPANAIAAGNAALTSDANAVIDAAGNVLNTVGQTGTNLYNGTVDTVGQGLYNFWGPTIDDSTPVTPPYVPSNPYGSNSNVDSGGVAQ